MATAKFGLSLREVFQAKFLSASSSNGAPRHFNPQTSYSSEGAVTLYAFKSQQFESQMGLYSATYSNWY